MRTLTFRSLSACWRPDLVTEPMWAHTLAWPWPWPWPSPSSAPTTPRATSGLGLMEMRRSQIWALHTTTHDYHDLHVLLFKSRPWGRWVNDKGQTGHGQPVNWYQIVLNYCQHNWSQFSSAFVVIVQGSSVSSSHNFWDTITYFLLVVISFIVINVGDIRRIDIWSSSRNFLYFLKKTKNKPL